MILQGVTSIIITPFTETGDVDLTSLERLIEHTLDRGVTAVTALGIAAEAHKLSPEEKRLVANHIFKVIAGQCPVIVGASANTAQEVIETTALASSLGADGVMIAPPNGWTYGPKLIDHYKAIRASTSLPIVLQDYEDITKVHLTPANMAELCREIPQMSAIKLETVPTPERIQDTKQLVGDKISIVGGIGGVYFFEELNAGANGTMTGFAFPECLVDIWTRFSAGDTFGAKNAFESIRRVLEFEGQPKIGLAIRKEILRRRGWISYAGVRQQPLLDQEILNQLDLILEGVQL